MESCKEVVWLVGGSVHFARISSLATSLLELQNICEFNFFQITIQNKMAQQITQRKQQGKAKILS